MQQRKPVVRRREFLAGTVAVLGLSPRVPAQAKAAGQSYVVIGDWGRGGADHQRAVGIQLGRTAEAIGSRFTVSVGDNFYEDGVSGPGDPQWRTSFEEIYTAPSLMTPWHVILGNHDYRGDVAAQIGYSATSRRWSLPARYYQRTETIAPGVAADYFFIDTSPFVAAYRGTKVRIEGQDTGAQLAWLERALGQSQAAWKIVFGHHPVFTVPGGELDTAELIGQVKPLLDRHGVRAYINGHVHNQQDLTVDGVHYITSGAGSQTFQVPAGGAGQFTSGAHGFMTVAHDADAFRFAFIDEFGAELYHATIARS